MLNKHRATVAATIFVGVLLAAVAAQAQYSNLKRLSGVIRIDGSSTVYPITEAVAEEFAEAAPRVKVTVGISGTGGGFKRFTVGETDISDASRPIKAAEYEAAVSNGVEFIEIPVAYDGLSVVVNKDNYWVDYLTVDELKMMFLDGGRVQTWRDVRPEWPEAPIAFYSPGTDSGTFDYFKEVVAGKTGSIRSDMQVSEDDNVLVRGVLGDKNSIGFFGASYYFENEDKLKVVPIDNGDGPIEPTPETIENGTYEPFSRPLFIYVNAESAREPHVKAFVEFYFEEGPALAEEVGYVRLPRMVYDRAIRNFRTGRTGTQFLDAAGNKIRGGVTEVYR